MEYKDLVDKKGVLTSLGARVLEQAHLGYESDEIEIGCPSDRLSQGARGMFSPSDEGTWVRAWIWVSTEGWEEEGKV